VEACEVNYIGVDYACINSLFHDLWEGRLQMLQNSNNNSSSSSSSSSISFLSTYKRRIIKLEECHLLGCGAM
jgi:hypothetical protein